MAKHLGRFASVRDQVAARAKPVLHGTNGFTAETMKKCIAAGVSKVNVNRLVLDDYYTHLRAQAPTLTPRL